MSKLLINEYPLMIIPSLAVKLGLNEAVVLQQIHYWIASSTHQYDGRKWVFNTYKDWQLQLPFWSESTIKRTIKSLEDQGYLLSANHNRSKLDQTKWYSIDYQKLAELNGSESVPGESEAVPVVVTSVGQAVEEGEVAEAEIPVAEVIAYLNEKTNAAYKSGTRKTRELIAARWKEGYTIADYKKVIDLKAVEWLNDPKWNKYLRPETLFGVKFESYLNQKSPNKLFREEDFDLDDEA